MTLECTVNSEGVSRLLNEALITEIICILRHKRHYFMTTEIGSRHVKSKFPQYVAGEQAHADQLAEHIIQLGTKLELSLGRLLNPSHAEHVEGDSWWR